jgi:hypothetical protein
VPVFFRSSRDGSDCDLRAPVDTLSQELSALAAALPNYLVVLAGSPSTASQRRQLSVTSIDDGDAGAPQPVLQQDPPAPAPSTRPAGGLLARYQLLTPGLITALLVGLLVLVPALVFAVSALASIQNPVRVEAPKGYDAQAKKSQ